MILQALFSYYEAQAAKGRIAKPGWGRSKISYGLELDASGALIGVFPLKYEAQRGNKMVMVPREMLLPAPAVRTAGVLPNFLWDNSAYILGIDGKGKPKRVRECFEAAKNLHFMLLGASENPAAKAICAFFSTWNTDAARKNALLAPCMEDLEQGANLVFFANGAFAQDDPEMQALWQTYYDNDVGTQPPERCLVTGALEPPVAVHPSIKGVRGAQSSGAALVSFNAPAFCSHGKEQNLNAPISKYAAFAYTTALNQLIADKRHSLLLGDSTVVFWTEDAEDAYGDAIQAFLNGTEDTVTDETLRACMEALAQGDSVEWDGIPLKPDNRFYILALAPNAARLSVRFFLQDSFGALAENIKKHYDDLYIVRDNRSRFQDIPLWALLQETVNQNARDKTPLLQMAADMLRAVLTGGRYPETVYQQTQLRIRAEREVTRGRAAIIKAYLLRNTQNEQYKEGAIMELNDNTTYQPYVLGRLFAVLEAIQAYANPGISTTIKDKYFTSAGATPRVVFPILLDLAQNHLKKMGNGGMKTYYAKQLGALAAMVTESYPAHHTLQEKGVFQLGYYHQTQKRYEKKNNAEQEEGGN